MPLLLKTDSVALPKNRDQCQKRLHGIKRKLKHYTEFMQKTFDNKHASLVAPAELNTSEEKVWYLPIFDVSHLN